MRSTTLASLALGLPLLFGCMDQKGEQEKARITKLRLVEGVLEIEGDRLSSIKSLSIKDASGSHRLSFKADQASRPGKLKASFSTPLTLVAGKVYQLIVSDAQADEVVPIVVEVPAGSFEPSALRGTGAGVGMVLKWNGSHWAPAPDYVGVGGSHGLMFSGYTAEYSGALGGLKGANAKCEQEYPGSHWADISEIMKLGAAYPWTYPVWVRMIDGQSSSIGDGRRNDNCFGWTQTLTVGGVPISRDSTSAGSVLDAYGNERRLECSQPRRLACVQ